MSTRQAEHGPPGGPTERPRPTPGPRGRRRRWLWLSAAVLAVLVAATLIWFQPQKLFYDDRVEQAPPSATAPAGGGPAAAAAQPVEIAGGAFISREHPTHGTVRVLRLADGRVIVRLEGFDTSNGPVLVVWLSTNPAHGPDQAFDDHHADLGSLQGNVGDQNYRVPGGVDVTAYSSVVVWCARFHVSFGAADLTPSP